MKRLFASVLMAAFLPLSAHAAKFQVGERVTTSGHANVTILKISFLGLGGITVAEDNGLVYDLFPENLHKLIDCVDVGSEKFCAGERVTVVYDEKRPLEGVVKQVFPDGYAQVIVRDCERDFLTAAMIQYENGARSFIKSTGPLPVYCPLFP